MSSGEPTPPTPPVNGTSLPPPAPTHPPAGVPPTAAPPSGTAPTAGPRPSIDRPEPDRPGPIGVTPSSSGTSDWPAQAADAIVDTVAKVRDATTGPVLKVARGVVYGTAIAILGLTALILLVAGAIRALDAYLPGEVWSAYLLLGVLFTALGLFLWSRRRPAGTT
jgi:hypothetical protein